MPYEKVGKNDPVCIVDEVPFDIPESWEWVRLTTLGEIVGGGTPKTNIPEYWDKGNIPWLTPADMKFVTGKYVDKGERCITEEGLKGSSAHMMPAGTIVYSSRAPIGYIAIASMELCTNQGFKSLVPVLTCIDDYVYYCLIAFTPEIQSRASGTTFKEISGAEFGKTLIPLPPLAEQQRIVKRIEDVLPALKTYDIKETVLRKMNDDFPDKLRKSILQWAVQGKLVPQDPTDEPASILLEHIREEKQKLIREGKIKKDKHESVIFRRDNSHYEKLDGIEHCIDGEIPFDIPDSWAWTSVGEVCTNIQYGSSQKSSLTGKIAVLRMGNLQNGRIVLDKLVYTSDSKEIEKYPLEYNDLLFNRTNSKELVGKVAIYKSEIPAIYAGYLVRLHPLLIDSDYLNYVMQSQYYWIYCQNVRSDAIGQSNINAEKLKRFIFPLPPLQEQKRIVNQISCAMSKIEHL